MSNEMLPTGLDIFGGLLVLAGAFLALSGSIGVIRFPNFFARLHPAGIADSLSTPLVIVGLVLILGWDINSLKLLLLLLFLMFTNPTSCHALAKAAWLDEKTRKLAKGESIGSNLSPSSVKKEEH